MKRPPGLEGRDSEPLLILWEPVGPKKAGAKNHLFTVATSSPDFPVLWVFSVSSYLRSLKGPYIDLPMPHAVRRIQAMNRMFTIK